MATPSAVDLAMDCFYPGQQIQVRISLQPNQKHESLPIPQSPVKNLHCAPKDCFSD